VYPHKPVTKAAIARLPPKERERLEDLQSQERTRINRIDQEHWLRTELDEAAQKWTFAYEALDSPSEHGMSPDMARFEMGLAHERYWTAMRRLEKVLDRTRLVTRVQFWAIVIGGLVLTLVSTVYTILSYYKS
jgi:hypothetical protein